MTTERRHPPRRAGQKCGREALTCPLPPGRRGGEGGQAGDTAPRSSAVRRPQRRAGCRAGGPQSSGAAPGRHPSAEQVKRGGRRRRKATRLAVNFAAPVTNKQIEPKKDLSHPIPAFSTAAASLIGAEVIYLFDFSPLPPLLPFHTPPPFPFTSPIPPPSPAFPPLPHAAQTAPVPARRTARPGCSAAGGSAGCRERGGRAAGRRERRRAGAGQPPHRCRAIAESGREVLPDAPSSAPGSGGGRVILLVTAGTGQPGRGCLVIRAGKEGSRLVPSCCHEETGVPRALFCGPRPWGAPAAAVRRERLGRGAAAAAPGTRARQPPAGAQEGMDAALAVCAYCHSRGLCPALYVCLRTCVSGNAACHATCFQGDPRLASRSVLRVQRFSLLLKLMCDQCSASFILPLSCQTLNLCLLVCCPFSPPSPKSTCNSSIPVGLTCPFLRAKYTAMVIVRKGKVS